MSENPSDRPSSSIQGWVGGAILILIGAIFLVRNLTGFALENWWALFILIPAVTAFSRAYSIYQDQGRLTAEARGSMIGGFAITMVAVIFLFNLSFGMMWPLFLILGGVTLLINALLP